MKNRRGFSLVELLTALVLFSIVGTAIYQLLVNNQRVYRNQAERVDVNQSARAAISILPSEVRELSAGDPAGSDIATMTATSLTFKAMRGFYVLCQPPNVGAMEITLDASLFYGLRRLDATRDSLLIFVEGDSTTRADDGWAHADATALAAGTACPGGGNSITATVAGISAGQLGMVLNGSPVRGFEVAQVLLYTDGAGDAWLGGRLFGGGSWGSIQPIVGPLSSGGLTLEYYDSLGAVTAVPAAVARIAITVETQSTERVRGTSGSSTAFLLQDLLTQVAIRNNPIY